MNIGVDVDGVLVELESYQLEMGAIFFKKKYGYDIVNPAGFDIREIFDCTEKERKSFWLRHIWKHIIFHPAQDNAAKVLGELHTKGHKIYIITSRVYTTQRGFLGWLSRAILTNWLKRHGVVYDEIFFCSERNSAEDKMRGCKKYEIDVMIEDKAENIIAISEFTKVICFDAAYNRDCEGENIIRVRNWNEVYSLINQYE